MHAERFDALVTFAGCDKSLPGMLMAAARLNLPAVFLYGGSILPGQHNGQALDIVSVFEAVGAHAAGTIDDDELGRHRAQRLPHRGRCAGMFTANTMASVAEAIGMSLPGSVVAAGRRPPPRRLRLRVAARPSCELLELGIRPRQILTKEAFENAIAVVDGPRRLDQRRAAPAGHRRTRRGSSSSSTTSTGSPPGCRTSPTRSRTASTTWSTSTASAACRW